MCLRNISEMNLRSGIICQNVFRFFLSLEKFLQLLLLEDNICVCTSGLLLPVMTMTVALNTNVIWFSYGAAIPAPSFLDLIIESCIWQRYSLQNLQKEVRFLCVGRNGLFVKK